MALLASRCMSRVFWRKFLPTGTIILPPRTPDRNLMIRSKMFPEYSLIFELDRIRTASRLNRTKFHSTIVTAGGIPTLYIAEQLGYILPDTVYSFTFFGCAITLFLHSIGFLFNNTIGYVYLKDDNETIKLSYVDYWGNRKDIDTAIDNIYAFSDVTTRFSNPWYERIRFVDSKKSFKIYITAGKILDYKSFDSVFGKVY